MDHRGQFPCPSSFLIVRVAFSSADSDSGVGIVADMFFRAVSRTKGCGGSERISQQAIVQPARCTLVQ